MADEHGAARTTSGAVLLAADDAGAEARARAIAAETRRTLTRVSGDAVAAETEPAEATRRALRDAVLFVERRMARVFEGRLVAAKPIGSAGTPGVPPARVAVTLQAADDSRVLHLEGAWAWNLAASGARAGDIVQIARDAPFVTLRHDREDVEGRVLDERDHLLMVRLGALDQAHAMRAAAPARPAPATPPPGGADAGEDISLEEEDILLVAARLGEHLFATGERPPTGALARRATDEWLRRRLATPQARLVPGILLVRRAAALPASAAAALRAATEAPGAPLVLLADADEAASRITRERFPAASQ